MAFSAAPSPAPAASLPGFRRPKWLLHETPRRAFNKRLDQLRSARDDYFLKEWREISDHIHPRRGKYLLENTGRSVPRRSAEIINITPTLASRTLASGMMSGISSPARPWYRLTTPDPDLAEFSDVKVWLNIVQRRMNTVMAKSNFYNSLHMVYRDLGDFGNGVITLDEDYEDVIRATVFAPGEYFLDVGGRGAVDSVYREHKMTVLQMVTKYGDRCSAEVISNYDNGTYDKEVELVTAIEVNDGRVPGGIGPQASAYVFTTYEKAGVDRDDAKALDVKPYYERAALAPRWDVQAGDVYGSGCGILALGDCKALQFAEKRKAQAIDKIVKPPMRAHISLKNSAASHLPGGITYYETTGQAAPAFEPAYVIDHAAITALSNDIKEQEHRIDQAYFKDLFLMLANSDRREITAREVEEKHEEKLLALGPVLERLHDELLSPAVDRVFAIVQRAGILPKPPKELEDVDLEIEFVSILAQAQRAIAVGGMERVAGMVGQLMAVFPEAGDKFDADQYIDEYADAIGSVPSIIRSDDAVAEIRKQRQAAQQQQQAMEQGMAAAQSAKVLSEAKLTDPNMLSQVLGTA